jgi:hypothetical protein
VPFGAVPAICSRGPHVAHNLRAKGGTHYMESHVQTLISDVHASAGMLCALKNQALHAQRDKSAFMSDREGSMQHTIIGKGDIHPALAVAALKAHPSTRVQRA